MARPPTWDVPMSGDARFSWDYDDGRAHLLALYQKGKDKQWDATTRIDWSVDVDPANALGTPTPRCRSTAHGSGRNSVTATGGSCAST